MAGAVISLLIVGLWPSVILPGHLAASYHRCSLLPPDAAHVGGFAQLRARDIPGAYVPHTAGRHRGMVQESRTA